MQSLEKRVADLEKVTHTGAAARIERIRLVGVNPDGSRTEGAVINVPPVKNGRADFSKVPDDELRKLARIRIEDAD